MRLRGLLPTAIAALALTPVCQAAAADPVTLGAADQNQTLLGPALAGSEVVWGVRTLPGSSRAQLSVLAAIPGAHGATLFSTRPLSSSEQEVSSLGLVASPTRIAFAYQVEVPECGLMSGACGQPDLREVLAVAAFAGPLGGPFRKLAGASLKNGAVGLSGEELVLAEHASKGDSAYVQDLADTAPARDVGAVGAAGVSVAGPYIASSSGNAITVMTLAGTPVYSVPLPLADAAGCVSDSSGAGIDQQGSTPPCGFALDADGTLAIAGSDAAGLDWASPAQPQLHPIAVALAAPLVAIANDEIVYLSALGAKRAQLALTDLSGGTRPISAAIEGGPEAVSGLAFNGTSVAWADHCVYAASVSSGAPSAAPAPACEAVTIQPGDNESTKVTAGGRVRITLTCQYSPCSGSLALTSVRDRSIGSGRHRRLKRTTVTIASRSFAALPVREADNVSLSLSRSGLKLLQHSRRGLSATVTATVALASTSQRTSAAVSLHGGAG